MEEPLLIDLERNVFLEGDDLIIVDRRKLPHEIFPVRCANHEEVARAIEDMAVQGAGDIAVTAGFGLYLEARKLRHGNRKNIFERLTEAAERLKATRPTGYHLATLVDRIMGKVREGEAEKPADEIILAYLKKVLERQRTVSKETGRHAATLLARGDRILTHCFAGPALLYMLRFAREQDKEVKVICTETRPYLQGARLTAWSVSQLGVDTTLITDNMAAYAMSRAMVGKVFTAADRIALDGTVANKVGTLQLALSARHFGIPFYILAYGGPDRRTPTGADIPIEMRDPREVLTFCGIPISGKDVKAFYPAFDLTPRELITGIITAQGVEIWE